MLAAWRAEIEAEPIPELIDLDTAVAAVVAGMKADEAGTRRKRADRMRHLAPLAAAAAIIVATISGVGLGSQDAMPGDTLWAIQKVVNPERAESVETKIVVESRLAEVRMALSTGDTETAGPRAAGDQHGDPGGPGRGGAAAAPPGAGVPGREAGRDAARHARGPVHAADERSDRPLDDRGRPPPPASSSVHVRHSLVSRRRASRRCRSRSSRIRVARRARRSVPAPASGAGFGGADDSPDSGSSAPDVTKAPRTEPAPREHARARADDVHRARAVRRQAGVRGRREPARRRAVRRAGSPARGHHGDRETASGSAGTNIDATVTATTS